MWECSVSKCSGLVLFAYQGSTEVNLVDMGRKVNGLERCGVAGPWTRHAVRVCHSRLARSSRWFYAGGGGLVGKPVHAVHGPYNGSKLRGHYYSLKEASGKANCLIRDSPEGCGISCRRALC